MAVTAREAWTDERLDDLVGHMDQRFDSVDKRFDSVDKRFDGIDTRFKEVKDEIRDLRTEISGMQRTMIIGFVTLFASIVASVIGGLFAAAVLL